MPQNKVVVKYQDGTIKKGETRDFQPNKDTFHLQQLENDDEITTIVMDKLKAVFFVKDFTGNKDYNEIYEDVVAGGGRKVQVKFFDGEIMIGYAQVFMPKRSGFFIIPADKKSNNERIYVVSSATDSVRFV